MNHPMLEMQASGTVIKVVGVGGAGGNAVAHMIDKGVQGVEFICANTDAQALRKSRAKTLIQLGNTGLGAGANPDVGRTSAEAERARIADALRGAHMVFITAGMGGGTGTGAAPVVAEVAKELGALTVAVVTKPFVFEGNRRMKSAEAGIAQLQASVDSLVVVLNEKLEEQLGEDVTMAEAFGAADDVLNNAVAGIAEIINVEGLVNVDFEDVRTVMREQGKAMMGTASASGPDRARIAAEQAVRSPLLEGVDLTGARGVLVNITAGRDLKMRETRVAVDTVRNFASDEAIIIMGAVYDDTLTDEMRVTVVATGLGQARAKPKLVAEYNATTQAPMGSAGQASAAAGMSAGMAGGLQSPVSQPMPMARTGTYDAVAASEPPDVWVTPVRSEAAAKVAALQESGFDPIDIPAFLRKQAD